jgi:hypothetical protein
MSGISEMVQFSRLTQIVRPGRAALEEAMEELR